MLTYNKKLLTKISIKFIIFIKEEKIIPIKVCIQMSITLKLNTINKENNIKKLLMIYNKKKVYIILFFKKNGTYNAQLLICIRKVKILFNIIL